MLLRNRNADFDALLLANYRWPKKGDRLLRPSKDWDNGVEFAKDPHFAPCPHLERVYERSHQQQRV